MRAAAQASALRYGSVEPKDSSGANGYASFHEDQVGGGLRVCRHWPENCARRP